MATDKTFVHTLAGRDITFLEADGPRLQLLRRVLDQRQRNLNDALAREDGEVASMLIRDIHDMVWTAIEAQFTDPADLLHVQRAILARELDEADLYVILANGALPKPADDADPPAAKPRKKAAAALAKKGNARGVR